MSEERIFEAENELIEGRNAVIEALRAGRAIDKIYLARGDVDKTLGHIASTAREKGVVVVECDRRKLDYMSRTHAHQGVIALCAVRDTCSIDDIFAIAEERGEPPFVIVCDGIEDPHNLGSIIRSANIFGAHGVIVPKRGAAGLTAVVSKASAGAVWHTPVVRVTNVTETLKELKKRGLWVYGAAADGASVDGDVDLSGAAALVIGAEGDGISRLVRENCDVILSIPMRGDIESLNASVAAGILMYLFMEGRK